MYCERELVLHAKMSRAVSLFSTTTVPSLPTKMLISQKVLEA